MHEQFDGHLHAHVLRDQDDRLREIRHFQEYWESEQGSPLAAAIGYLHAMASEYEVPTGELDNLALQATHLDPRPQPVESAWLYGLLADNEHKLIAQLNCRNTHSQALTPTSTILAKLFRLEIPLSQDIHPKCSCAGFALAFGISLEACVLQHKLRQQINGPRSCSGTDP